MAIENVFFPKDKPREQAEPIIDKVFEAVKALGIYVEPQAFLYNWAMLADNTRVYIGRDSSGAPVSFAHMTFGRRFHDRGFSASLTIMEASTQVQREMLLEHVREQAKLLGAEVLLYEGKPADSWEGTAEVMPLRALKLG